ncbi:MAG: DNA mismatch repair protein MutS, partial [Flavobacteriales bacterium]
LNGDEDLRTGFQALFKSTGDLERLASKASTGRINPRELGQLRQGLEAVQSIAALSAGEAPLLPYLERLTPCDQLLERLRSELVKEPPVNPAKGQVIEQGVSAELDELRTLKSNAQAALDAICARETERTGISSLKIAYNQVFGYYLEVRNTHKDKVPAEWIRKQTLTQAERYITEELKELEAKILDAQERTASLELACFHNLVQAAAEHIGDLQQNAHVIGALDALTGLAQVAIDNDYVRPRLNDAQGIQIKNGRHPVIERALKPGEPYIANDVALHPDSNQILMITGPNMAGKSALLRQTALICLMAQMGGYVPAASADLGILDRIFTRVGASDNISSGESTFMVEMNETAAILNNLTPRSLVLLDEIGRGTSTYDGVSIAWSIAEYLHEHPHKALTLFATHYHELNAMQERFHRVVNLNVTVREVDGKIIFLRKLAQGGSNHSFGINVAQLAGMPTPILRRAKEVLKQLESSRKQLDYESASAAPVPDMPMASDVQLSFFQLDDPVLEQVREQILDLDIDNLTPVEALMKLNEIKKVVSGSAAAKSERP